MSRIFQFAFATAVTLLTASCKGKTASREQSTTATAVTDSISTVSKDSSAAPAVAASIDTGPETPQASSGAPQSSQEPSGLPVASLIDWKFFPGGDSSAKVAVAVATRADTLPGVFAVRDPLVTKDGMVHGIATTEDGGATGGFDYNPATRKLTRFPLPKDVNASFPDIELNESAEWVAYIAHSESGQSWAVVRTWPRLELVAKSDSSPGYPSDAETDVVGWADSTHFNLSYVTRSGAAILVTGDARARKIKTDSIAAKDLPGH